MSIKEKQLEQSALGLKGLTPNRREGADAGTTKVHVKGIPATVDINHSVHDLDGLTPKKYQDNLPK